MRILYRIAYALMRAVGFTLRACLVLFFVGVFVLIGVGIWQKGAVLHFFLAILAAGAVAFLLWGWFTVLLWLRGKVDQRRIT